MSLSRRGFLGRAAVAPVAATAVMDQVAKHSAYASSNPVPQYTANLSNAPVVGSEYSAAQLAARKALRAMDRRNNLENLVWLDSMRSWPSATKVRAMKEWRAAIKAEGDAYRKILGWLDDD